MSINNILCISNILSYCYHSVNGISYGLAQSDPIKQFPVSAMKVFILSLQNGVRLHTILELYALKTSQLKKKHLVTNLVKFKTLKPFNHQSILKFKDN
jgi:hypothetical protein